LLGKVATHLVKIEGEPEGNTEADEVDYEGKRIRAPPPTPPPTTNPRKKQPNTVHQDFKLHAWEKGRSEYVSGKKRM